MSRVERTKEQQGDLELRENVEQLAKISLQLYERFQDPSETHADTPQLTKKWHKLAKAIKFLR